MNLVKKAYPFFLIGFFFMCHRYSFSEEVKNSFADSNSWYAQSQTVVRVLDKLEFKTILLTIPVGSETSYKSLTIKSRKCLVRSDSLPRDSAAYIDIIDSDSPKKITFSAWLFSEEPGLSVFENPLYNVKLVRCSGSVEKDLSKFKHEGTLLDNSENNSSGTLPNSNEELENSLQQSIDNQR